MKRILALILCALMLASVAFMTACNKTENDEPGQDSTSDDTTEYNGPETVEPIDTSKIEPAQGGDIVGTWLSDAIPFDLSEDMTVNYNAKFVFNEDGTCSYLLSMSGDEDMRESTYSVDGANITFGEGLNLPNATFTVDGDILLLNSDTLNVAFRRQ